MNTKAVKLFLIFYSIFFVALLTLVLLTEQADLHLMLTRDYLATGSLKWVDFQDVFFKCITEIGASGPLWVGLALLFYKVGPALLILASQIASTLIVYPVKNIVCAPRPKPFFETNFPDVVLHQVQGIDFLYAKSFPSGHTAAAFSLMLCLTLVFRKKPQLAPLFLLLAIATGYSRVYLSQHFSEDVLVGSAVGVVMTLLTFWLYQRFSQPWFDQSIVEITRKLKKKNDKKR